MKNIKAIVLLAVLALGLAGAVKAATHSCCASADCCASGDCGGCSK